MARGRVGMRRSLLRERGGASRLGPGLAAVALAAALCAGASGGHAPAPRDALSPAWREATARVLGELLVPTPAYPVFLAPDRRPRLAPVAEAALALRAAGEPVPAAALRLVRSFRGAGGLYADERGGLPPLVTTWLAARLLGERVDPAVLEARRAAGGYAWDPGGAADPVATLYAVRLGAAKPADPGRVACPADAPSLVRAAVGAESGAASSCSGARVAVAAGRAARGLAQAARIGLSELETVRAAVELERAGVAPSGTAAPLLDAAARALLGGEPPGSAQGTQVTAVRTAADALVRGGRRVVLSRSARRLLLRTIRFQGRLPDVAVPADPLPTVLGVHALALARPGSTAAVRRLARPGRAAEPADRALLALGAGRRPRDGEVRVLAERALERPSARDLAVAALAARRAGRCPAALASELRGVTRRLLERRDDVAAAAAHTLYWIALVEYGAGACGGGEPGLAALVRTRLKALADERGLFRPHGRSAPDPLETWWGNEAVCAAGAARPLVDARGVAALAREWALPAGGARDRPGATVASALPTYALLRVAELAAHGCSPGWWGARRSIPHPR